MLYGWVNKEDATRITGDEAWQTGDYYCGDENDGSRASGWMKLDVVKDDEDKSYWFYFNPSMVRNMQLTMQILMRSRQSIARSMHLIIRA